MYEIDDDDSQNNYHSPDAFDTIDDDNVDDKFTIGKDDKVIDRNGDGDSTRFGNVERPINNRRQQSSKYTDRIDDGVGGILNGDNAQKQQPQRYDDDDENGARQRHHSTHAVETDKSVDRQMNHKHWGKGK